MIRGALLACLLWPMLTLASNSQEWRFRVFLEDSEIGTHSFRVIEAHGERQVESDAQFTVRVLFFDAYTYSHRARERWRGDCLIALDATTNDNGELLTVRGARRNTAFDLTATRGQAELPACVMPFAYWNPSMLRQPQLLNVQTGELIDVRVEALGEENLQVQGRNVLARRYALHAAKFRIDVWYIADRHWVQLESTTESGRRLRYQIQ